MRKTGYSLLAALACISQFSSVHAQIDCSYPENNLARLISKYGFAPSDVSVLLFDPVSGRSIVDHQSDTPRIPASTTKAPTIIAALNILGQDHRFKTQLWLKGKLQPPEFQGTVFLKGGGDPSLSSDDLFEFVAALKRLGVTKVVGGFAYDDSLLPQLTEIDKKQPDVVDYNTGVGALSLNYNRVILKWQKRKGGYATEFYSPAESVTVPINAISTGLATNPNETRFKVSYAGGQYDRWLLSPMLPNRGSTELPVKANIGFTAASVFRAVAAKQGLELPTPQPARVPDDAQLIYTHQSATLSEIGASVLRYSNNLTAELIGLAASSKLIKQQPSSLQQSANALAQWFRSKMPRINWSGFQITNHSGLSNQTHFTARQLGSMLTLGSPSLRKAAISGSSLLPPITWNCQTSKLTTPVRAKSGTMNYADGLAGFIDLSTGKQLGFVILINDSYQRTKIDARFDPRVGKSPPGAGLWTKHAKVFERELLQVWLNQFAPPIVHEASNSPIMPSVAPGIDQPNSPPLPQ